MTQNVRTPEIGSLRQMEDQEQQGTPDADEALSDAAADTTKTPDVEEEADAPEADDAMADASLDTEKTPDATDNP
jgi:hypothetical protein